jgi:alpha-mannosidase
VVLSVLKQSEDGTALVARLYETAGAAVDTQLSLPVWNRTIPLSFAPYEIKTVRIHSDVDATEVDLLELPTA